MWTAAGSQPERDAFFNPMRIEEIPQLALITGCVGASSFFSTPCSTSFWIKPVSY
jgi:hypothetical protein